MALMEKDDAARYQLRLRGAAKDALDEMVEKLGSTPKDVILDALGLFGFAVEAVEQGSDVGSYDPRERQFTAILTPSLSALKKKRHARAGAVAVASAKSNTSA